MNIYPLIFVDTDKVLTPKLLCLLLLRNKGYGSAVLMDLSKVFDAINHELLNAKLNAHDFAGESLLIIMS